MSKQDLAEQFDTGRLHAKVFRHGKEREPIVVLDNYLADPAAMIATALAGPAFTPLGPYYPGVRAPFPGVLLEQLLAPLGEVLRRCFAYAGQGEVRECSFSLVTTRPEELMPIQRLPHFDSLEYGRVAALLFLGQGENNGGTAFYRQRSTGFETVDAGRFGAYEAALNADVARLGLPSQDYVADDSPMFDTLAVHEGQFNRMLVYRSATLHSGRIPKDFAFETYPAKGRLTVNAFLGMAG